MHSSLLKEDLREPKNLAGYLTTLPITALDISIRAGHEISPGWSATLTLGLFQVARHPLARRGVSRVPNFPPYLGGVSGILAQKLLPSTPTETVASGPV